MLKKIFIILWLLALVLTPEVLFAEEEVEVIRKEAEDFYSEIYRDDDQEHIQQEDCEDVSLQDPLCLSIGYITNGSGIKLRLPSTPGLEDIPINKIRVRVASNNEIGQSMRIEIRKEYYTVDAPTPHAVCTIVNTGGWQEWQTVECQVSSLIDFRDINIQFVGPANEEDPYLFNINWFEFISDPNGVIPLEADDGVEGADSADITPPSSPIGGATVEREGGEIVSLENPLGTTLKDTDIRYILGGVIQKALGILGSITLVVFIYGGFLWLTSAGNQERVKKGGQTMLWAAVGVFIIFASYAILDMLIKGLTG